MTTIGLTYGIGGYLPDAPNGNIVETVTAEKEDGAWSVVVCNGSGLELSRREASEDEAATFEPAPVVEPVPVVDDSAELRAQVAALTARLDAIIAAFSR